MPGPIGRDASFEEIEAASDALLGHKFHDIELELPEAEADKIKGKLGEALEHYYGMENDIEGEPDFRKEGIELKCKPLKTSYDRFFYPKEPLSVGMIDYKEVAETEHWEDIEKLNKKFLNLMIFWFVYDEGSKRDFPFIWWQIWSPSQEIREKIQEEYEVVRQQILRGEDLSQSRAGNDILQTCPKHNSDFSSYEKGSYVVNSGHPHLDKPERRSWRIPTRFLVRMLAESADIELVEYAGNDYVRKEDLWEKSEERAEGAPPLTEFIDDRIESQSTVENRDKKPDSDG